MRREESGHRRRLIELYQQKFGEHIPLIRRQDVKGFVQRTPVWLIRPLGLDIVRRQALLKSKRADSMNGPRRAPRMPASASFSMISRRRNARTKIEPRS